MGKHCINAPPPPQHSLHPSSDMYSGRHKSRLELHTQIMSHSTKETGFRRSVTARFPTTTEKKQKKRKNHYMQALLRGLVYDLNYMR